MKRLGVRIAAVATLLVVGAVVLIQSQRNSDRPAAASETSAPRRLPPVDDARPLPTAEAAKANPLRRGPTAAMRDPFALPASASEPLDLPGATAGEDNTRPARQLPTPVLAGPRVEPYAPPRPMPGMAIGVNDESDPLPALAMPVAADPNATAVGTRVAPLDYMPPAAAHGVAPVELPAGEFPAGDSPPGALPMLPDAGVPEARPMRADPLMPVGREPSMARTTSVGPARPGALEPSGPTMLAPGRSAMAEPFEGGEGSGRPGAKSLEGPQTPQLQLQKIAPPEVQVGKPATFRIALKNIGSVAATNVEIHDQVPRGATVLTTTPRANRGVRGDLVWSLGAVKPGEEVTVEVQLMPVAEGEIGSVATVQFSADASARTIATKPQLLVETVVPERVQIGEQMVLQITVSNPGSGVATGVMIEEHIPAGLQHPAGADLEYEIGDLKPGESRKLDLTLMAARPGAVTNVLSVRGDGNLRAEDRKSIEITSPHLELALDGPKKRYLEREATYQVSISNPGTAPAQKVELVAFLPAGLKFVSANNAGHYDEVNRAVVWRLEELPVNETGTVELVTMPTEAGQQSLKLRTSADRGVSAEREHPVVIEGLAAIHFQQADTIDPVEVGGETTYEIRVVNQGSKAASNVQLTVQLPPELKPLAVDGPTRYQIAGGHVAFEGLGRLAPKADTTYRVRVQAMRPGDLRTRVQLTTDDMQTPVTKEESTRVFADE